MWRDGFRAWFYISISAALLVSISAIDIYWLMIEIGMVTAILGRYPLYDQVEQPDLQRPLTLFMVFPFSIYVLMHLIGYRDGLFLTLFSTLTTMMVTLLLCLFVILILEKQTEFHMNYRFILGFATVAAISLASLFTFLSTSYDLINGEDLSNADMMWTLISVLFFGIVSGVLFKRDMRRMDYIEILMIDQQEEDQG